MCRRTEEGIVPTVGLPRYRHFVGFLNVPVLAENSFFIVVLEYLEFVCFNAYLCAAVSLNTKNTSGSDYKMNWACFGNFLASFFNCLQYFVWLRITDEGSIPEMRIWSILFIKSDIKWCIHLSRSPFLYLLKIEISCIVSFSCTKVLCSTGEVNWLFNVTINDISVIYVTAHRSVQADWRRSWTYGRDPNAIDIS